jgi:hypothetical protein
MSMELPVLYHIINNQIPHYLLSIFYLLPFIVLILIISISKFKISPIRISILFVFYYGLVITFVSTSDSFGQNLKSVAIYAQILIAYYMTKDNIKLLNRYFHIVAILGLFMLPYIYSSTVLDITIFSNRTYTWTSIFYYATIYWAYFPFVILSFIEKKYYTISVSYWISSILVNLLFLKRAIFVDSIILIITIVMINLLEKNKLKAAYKIILLISAISILTIALQPTIFSELSILTYDRYESTRSDINNFDRIVESRNYLSDASIFEILFGRGIGGSHYGLGVWASAIHIGWVNFILKGGIVLPILVLIVLFKSLSLLRIFNDLPSYMKYSVLIIITNSIRLLYINMYNPNPEGLVFFFALYSVADFNRKHSAQLGRVLHRNYEKGDLHS